ncbi:MAG: EF-hand domain-containing protein [Pseudomonadota bacterium]
MTNIKPNYVFALLLTGAAAMAVATAPAIGQEPSPEQMMARADANGDGDISWDEVMTLRTQSFERLDRNDDGVVSVDDRPRGPMAGRFDTGLARVQVQFDADGDGQVTEEEMMGAPAPAFEQGDVDEDGVLTAEEIAALRAGASPF